MMAPATAAVAEIDPGLADVSDVIYAAAGPAPFSAITTAEVQVARPVVNVTPVPAVSVSFPE